MKINHKDVDLTKKKKKKGTEIGSFSLHVILFHLVYHY